MGAVYREELSANARKLIEQLLSLPQGWVTAAALAESIGVSRRTVLRELPAVEQWMQAAGAHFVRNPGKGLLLDEAPERRDALRTQLNSGDRKKTFPRRAAAAAFDKAAQRAGALQNSGTGTGAWRFGKHAVCRLG